MGPVETLGASRGTESGKDLCSLSSQGKRYDFSDNLVPDGVGLVRLLQNNWTRPLAWKGRVQSQRGKARGVTSIACRRMRRR